VFSRKWIVSSLRILENSNILMVLN